MRIPPDLKQAMMGLGSISLFAVALFLHRIVIFYAFIGIFIAGTLGYTVYRTSKMLPVMKQNARDAAQTRKEFRDRISFRHSAKDTQPYFVDYERERLAMSKKMMIMMLVPLAILLVIYVGYPFMLKLLTGAVLTSVQHIELYVTSALLSLGASLIVRRRLGLNAASMGAGTQLVYAPKSYIVTEKGLIFEPAQKMPDVEYSILKFPASIKRVDKQKNLVEVETQDPHAPQQLKVVRLYTKDVDKLISTLGNYVDKKMEVSLNNQG